MKKLIAMVIVTLMLAGFASAQPCVGCAQEFAKDQWSDSELPVTVPSEMGGRIANLTGPTGTPWIAGVALNKTNHAHIDTYEENRYFGNEGNQAAGNGTNLTIICNNCTFILPKCNCQT